MEIQFFFFFQETYKLDGQIPFFFIPVPIQILGSILYLYSSSYVEPMFCKLEAFKYDKALRSLQSLSCSHYPVLLYNETNYRLRYLKYLILFYDVVVHLLPTTIMVQIANIITQILWYKIQKIWYQRHKLDLMKILVRDHYRFSYHKLAII